MCRKIASLLVECGAGRISLEAAMDLVQLGDWRQTPRAAPPNGLFLMSIDHMDHPLDVPAPRDDRMLDVDNHQ